jgi:hypothetical protein
MKIEISIWGIRRGFEKEGFFHTHNIAAVKATQQDRFRNICNSIGNKGFYNIQHIQGKTIISFIDSGVREYLPTGPRPGYAVFSLILSSQDVFEQSPRPVLLELAHFYRSRVGESSQNNFNSAEIEFFLNKLKIVPAESLQIRENVSAYCYYTDVAQIDHFLTGNIPFASFGELLFIPSEFNPSTGKFKEIDFIDDSFRSKPQLIDLRQAESQFLRDRESEIARQRQAEQERLQRQQQVQFLENDLVNMLKLNKKEEALQKLEQSPLRSYVNPSISHQLTQYKNEKEEQNKGALTQQQDKRLVDDLLIAWRSRDMDLALSLYKKLSNRTHPNLTFDITSKLEQYDANLKQMRQEEEDNKKAAREEEGKKAKKKKSIKLISFVSIICLFAASFFLKIPAGIWDKDSDGVYNWSDVCPNEKGSAEFDGCPDQDKDGIEDSKDKCIKDPGTVICHGCPDQDKDSITDAKDACPDEFGTKECKGCPDRDEDGVADKDDECPTNPGDKTNKGCPTPAGTTAPPSGNADITKVTIQTDDYPNLKRIFGMRFIRVNNNKYEISEKGIKFDPITKKEQIDALNLEFNKSIPGGTKKTGVTTTPGGNKPPATTKPPVTTNPPVTPKPPGTKATDFPNKAAAYAALNNFKDATGTDKTKYRKEFKKYSDAYYAGVTNGKYKEDKDFDKFLKKSLLTIEQQ